MAAVNTLRFVSQVTPPADLSAPAFWFLVQGEHLIVQQSGESAQVPQLSQPGDWGLTLLSQHYLGYLEDDQGARAECFCGEIAADVPLPPGMIADGLRQLYPHLGEQWFILAGRALQIVEWERTHRFCGRCGAAMHSMPGERARKCLACGLTSYPRLSPAVIVAVVRHTAAGPRLLLARNHRFPPGRYSVVAGFVEPGEALEDCVHREIAEETGVQVKEIRYFGSQPWPFPHSLMVGFTAEYAAGEIVLEEAEIADAQWFAADSLPLLPPKMSIARRLIDWFVAEYGGPGAIRTESW
jgi:NAD+ diphosphatase